LICALALFAQSDSRRSDYGSGLEQRIAVIETKLDNLKTLDDRVSKLDDKIEAMNLQLASINTKLEIIAWFGGAIGLLALGSLWKLITETAGNKTNPPGRDVFGEIIRAEILRSFRTRHSQSIPDEGLPAVPDERLPAVPDEEDYVPRGRRDPLSDAVEAGKRAYREAVGLPEDPKGP